MESKDLMPAQAAAMGILGNLTSGYLLKPPVKLDAKYLVGKAFHKEYGAVLVLLDTTNGFARAYREVIPQEPE